MDNLDQDVIENDVLATVRKMRAWEDDGAVTAICEVAAVINRDMVPGCFVHVGVYDGSLTLLMAYLASRYSRDLYVWDSFAGISAPREIDARILEGNRDVAKTLDRLIEQRQGCGQADRAKIEALLAAHDLEAIFRTGNFAEHLGVPMAMRPIALLHLHTWWYDETDALLRKCGQQASPDCGMVVTNFRHAPVERAAQLYRRNKSDSFQVRGGTAWWQGGQ